MEIQPSKQEVHAANDRPPLTARQPERSPIFFGADGLRAGWSILIYVVVLVVLLILASFEMRWLANKSTLPHKGGEFHPLMMIAGEAAALFSVLVATVLMARIEQRSVAFYGLAGGDRVRQFFIGLVSGFGFLSLLVAILVATHHLTLRFAGAPLGFATRYAAAWGLCFLLVGMTEELMLRGYLLFTLARGSWFWPAAFVLAGIFGFMHTGNHGESLMGETAAALIALVFSLSLWRLGHLWWAIGFHTSWDWGESYFYGTADSGTVSYGRLMHAHPAGASLLSGGVTGPEGSIWILLILVLAALFVWFTQPYRGIRLNKKAECSNPALHPTL